MVFVAGQQTYTVDTATERIREYAAKYPVTIREYDFGGPDEVEVNDAVSTSDLGRMVLINADLSGQDAAHLLNSGLEHLLRDLSSDLQLIDVRIDKDQTDRHYLQMNRAWAGLKGIPNIGRAKASKLLHLKRPKLFPIIDSHIERKYRDAATAEGNRLGSSVPHYWRAIAADIRENAGAFTDIREQLRATSTHGKLAFLSDLRLQDILAWCS